jgi:hypothetical protein
MFDIDLIGNRSSGGRAAEEGVNAEYVIGTV